MFPKTPQRILARIKSYEKQLQAEIKRFGALDDGAGKRYLLGPLYLLKGDSQGALKSFNWFEKICQDDVGEPGQYLCWTLTLLRNNKEDQAVRKLGQTMFKNLYLIPKLLGKLQICLQIYHSSNWEEPGYLDYIPKEIFELWNSEEKHWANEHYESHVFKERRKKYIKLLGELKRENKFEKRGIILEEISELESLALDR